ncbi:MAG: ChrR family anti-sigma-E factor [Dongiaceae bacterium]
MPLFHPADELLLAHAAGSATEAVSLLVASHLAFCPGCRRAVAVLEAIGGALLERLPPDPLGEDCLPLALAQLDRPGAPDLARRPAAPAPARSGALLPRPLRDYVPDIDAVAWQPASPGFDAAEIPHAGAGPRARLLRLRGGFAVPAHEHGGLEVLLVLEGALVDRLRYGRGDVIVAEAGTAHRPQAEAGPACICLAVLEGPWRVLESRGRPALMFR